MKAVISVLGLAIGIFLGVAMLLFNPVTLLREDPEDLSGAAHTLKWETGGGFRGFEVTPRGLLGAKNSKEPALDFKEPGIRYARVEIVPLAGQPGSPVALGVRLSAISDDNSLLQARLGIVTHWNVVWPGQDSLLLAGSENFLAPIRDGWWSAVRGRGFRPGRSPYVLPPVPNLGPSAVIGGAGRYAGASGHFREEMKPVDERPGDLIGRRWLEIGIK